jgi:tight adherence protein B
VRGFGVFAAVAVVAACAATASAAGVSIQRMDASHYPVLRVRVLAPTADAPIAVRVDGRRPRGLDATNLGRNHAIVLAIDRSRSMAGAPLAAAVAGARAFLTEKPRGDRTEIVTFGRQALALTGFEFAAIDGDTALRTMSVDARPGTALFDAAVLASGDLAGQPVRGRTLILLTDGDDRGSEANLADAIRVAHRNNIAVYGIELGGADSPALRVLATATGGRVYRSTSFSTLSRIYRTIGRELRRSWLLEFPTAHRPGDRVTISVSSDGAGAMRVLRVPGRADRKHSEVLPAKAFGGSGRIAIALLAGLMIAGSLALAFRRPRAEDLKRRVRMHEADVVDDPWKTRFLRRLEGSFAASEARLRKLRLWHRIDTMRERSNVPLRTVHLVYIGFGAAILVALFALAAGIAGSLALLTMVIVFCTPMIVVTILAHRRARALDEQLPDLLASLASSLRAGHGLKHALESIVETSRPPAAEELSRVLSEARLGRPLDEALLAMCERMGSDDLEYVAAAVRVQSQVGGSLAGLFDMVAETIRVRQRHARRVRALTATGRASAGVLTALPICLAVLLSLIDHSYLTPLLQTGIGRLLIVASAISMSIGGLALHRIVAVKG